MHGAHLHKVLQMTSKSLKKKTTHRICIFPGLIAKNKFDILSRLSDSEAHVIVENWTLGKPGPASGINESIAILMIRSIAASRTVMKNVTVALVEDNPNPLNSVLMIDVCL